MTDQIPIPFPDVHLVDFERWGRLIMTWATGESYFDAPHASALFQPRLTIDQLPVPTDREEFERQCTLALTGLHFPSSMTGLTIVRHSADQLFVSIPPKERIKEFERLLQSEGSGEYRFVPPFYRRYLGRPLELDEKRVFQACRIGDYSISFCG